MAEMLLDVTVFQDYMWGNPGAREIIDKVVEGTATASVAPLTLFQLWSSAGLDRRAEIGLLAMLKFMEEAPLSVEAAKAAAIWIAGVDEGEQEGLSYVALVAATARERSEPVCTRNAAAFNRFYSKTVSY